MPREILQPSRAEQQAALGCPMEVFDAETIAARESRAAREQNPALTLAPGASDDATVAFVNATIEASGLAHIRGRGDARVMVLKLARRVIATLAEQGTPATDVDYFDVRRAVRDLIVARMGAVPPLYSDVMGATIQEAMEEAVQIHYEEQAAELARERGGASLGVECWDGEEAA